MKIDKIPDGLEYIIIVLDKSAKSFCYYDNPNLTTELISFDTLKKSIDFCKDNGLNTSIIYGNGKLPDDYVDLLNSFAHIKINDIDDKRLNSSEGIRVIDFQQNYFDFLDTLAFPNIILRMNLAETKFLADIINNYHQKFSRLNVIFKDIENATENRLNDFRLDLSIVKDVIFKILRFGEMLDVSFATDRILLDKMNNCDAGTKHVTIAPNGKFYICPGFYYSDSDDNIGSLDDGIVIKNQHLLTLEYAPICSVCDCFQCKRCVYLNKRTTLEVNTPSHEQCVVAHHERNLSGVLLDRLHYRTCFTNYSKIPSIYHLDPFQLIRMDEI